MVVGDVRSWTLGEMLDQLKQKRYDKFNEKNVHRRHNENKRLFPHQIYA